ncbi:CRISPR-associated helicase Cas3 [Vibrio chagasii]|nr:CRISPR-associated helicase Cas3 [Vibrio chagasii]
MRVQHGEKGKKLHSKRLTKPTHSWTQAKLVTIRRHRIEGELSFGASTISRQQVLPNYERVWEQTIVEEAYQQVIVELLEQGSVVLRVDD